MSTDFGIAFFTLQLYLGVIVVCLILPFTPPVAGTLFSDPRGLQGWVDLGDGYIRK